MAKRPVYDPTESDFPFIGAPARAALFEAGYTHLAQLTALSETQLLALHGVGQKQCGFCAKRLPPKACPLPHPPNLPNPITLARPQHSTHSPRPELSQWVSAVRPRFPA